MFVCTLTLLGVLTEKAANLSVSVCVCVSLCVQRKTLTENKEKRLQDKIQLLEAKIEELELEAAAVKK